MYNISLTQLAKYEKFLRELEMHYTCNYKIICVKYFLQTLYSDWVVKDRRNITAILEDLPSVKPPIDHLCELLPRLQARYYSISSSPKVRTLKGDAMS